MITMASSAIHQLVVQLLMADPESVRREVTHHLLDAERLDEAGQDEVHQPGKEYTDTGIGQRSSLVKTLGCSCCDDGCVSPDEGERRPEECGDLHLGQQVEQEGAESGEEKRCADGESGERGDQDRCAEHGEHVLEPKEKHFRTAQRTGVVNGLGTLYR